MEGKEMKHAKSFCVGYLAVRIGTIDREWSNREISEKWPNLDADAVAEGIKDALAGDAFRYHEVRKIAKINAFELD